MPIALTEEHEALRLTAQRWLQTHCPPGVPRAAAEASSPELPAAWEKMAAQGWLGLHLAESDGGQGFGLEELGVVLEEMGYALFPGPVLSTTLVAALVARHGSAAQRSTFLPGLADGTTPAGVALGAGALQRDPDGRTVSGALRPVLGGPTASVVLAPVAGGGWCLLPRREEMSIETLPALDATRPVGQVVVTDMALADDQRLPDLTDDDVRDLALVLAAAEGAGVARWCLDTASEYAKVRVQFGRPIGQFQAIKHALADMLVAVEQSAAVAWDAATAWSGPGAGSAAADGAAAAERSLSARVAGALSLEAVAHCAKKCVQILGGIGFTWEHDAHFYLKRAMAIRLLLADVGTLEHSVATLALVGTRRGLTADLPPEAEGRRAELRPLVQRVAATDAAAQRRRAGRGGPDHAPLAGTVGPRRRPVGPAGD